MAIIADVKKSAFYKAQPVCQTLVDTLRSMSRRPVNQLPKKIEGREREEFQRNMKDIAVKNEATNREFMVDHLSHKDATLQMHTYKDAKRNGMERTMSVAQYYGKEKQKPLQFPGLPLLAERIPVKGPTEYRYHPMEFCTVLPNQTVPIHKQTPEQMQEMIKKSALKPSDNLADLQQKVKETHLISNQNLANLGLQMSNRPMELLGRVREKPGICYQKEIQVDFKGNWDQKLQKFHTSGKCGKWAAIAMAGGDKQILEGFLQKFQDEGARLGIRMGKCVYQGNAADKDALENIFKNMARLDVEFVFFFLPDRGMDRIVKDYMKLYEMQFEIITQCVKMRVATQIVNDPYKGRMTLNNILLKTNMKLGGLNYDVILKDKRRLSKFMRNQDTMFIGCDVTHPPPQPASQRHMEPRQPSIVGFVANDPLKPLLFTGEFALQSPRNEMVESMKSLTKEMIHRWQTKSPEHKLPKNVMYFRDGVSVGQLEKIINEEVRPMKQAFREAMPEGAQIPRFTVVVCIKRHHERLYKPSNELNPNDNATRQDLPPGTVVDTDMVHAERWEFFLKAHVALQGTAKPLKVNVILDEIGMSQDEMEDVCFALCHGHQIVNKVVSLPAPVYGAHEMAERGKRLYKAWFDKEMSVSDESSQTRDSGYMDDAINWDDVTQKLKVAGTILADRKYWA
jgi:hypothetical protein